MIKYLSSKDPIFDILLFNFNDPKLIVSSITFYTNFLNVFFLKKSKEELTERCATIIFGNLRRGDVFYTAFKLMKNAKKDPYKMENMLSLKSTFDALVYFLCERSTHFALKVKKTVSKYYENVGINELNKNDLINPEIGFYQLQIIFNNLDNQSFKYHMHECLLIAIRKIRSIKVPKYKYIAQSIIAKNISLIRQKRRFNSFLNKNCLSSVENQDDLIFEDKRQLNQPETFNQRFIKQSLKLKEAFRLRKHSSIEYQTPEKYWNTIDDMYTIDNGILFKNQSEQEIWISNIKNYTKNVELNTSNKSEANLFNSIPKENSKLKLYKLFVYNEKVGKWEKNTKGINELVKDKLLDKLNPKLSFILFLNSFENDLVSLNSNLISFTFPHLSDDDIYIYALLDKPLSLLEYEITFSSQEKQTIKPLFLLLHVPNREINNINSIILKIYHFLSIISDVEIVILNKKYYNDQINLIKKLNNLKRSYSDAVKIKKNSTNEIDLLKSVSKINEDTDFSSDGDEFENNEEQEEDLNDHLYDLINFNIFEKKHELILLFNDDCVQSDILKNMNENAFFDSFQQLNDLHYHACYININMPVTYRCFLTSLNEAALKNNSSFRDSFCNFDFIQISDLTNSYVKVKSRNKWKPKLKKLIHERFRQLKQNNLDGLNDLSLTIKLNKELIKIRPSIDIEFTQECNLILDDIRNRIIKKNEDIFIQELKQSSLNSIEYLTALIQKADFIPSDKKKSMKDSHDSFLRNEFFDIIKALYPKDAIVHVFNKNSSILENQIEIDKEALKNIFKKYSPKNDEKVVNLIDSIREGTNYTIKETENIREIEVVVEAGNLEKVIKQDF